MRGRRYIAALAAVLAAALSACSTPEPVRDLATRTAANVTQVGSHLQNLDTASDNVAEARATNVARLKDTVREVRGRHSLDIALIKKSGDASSLTLKNEIADWIIEARAAAHGMTVKEFEAQQEREAIDPFAADIKAIMDSLENLDTKSAELREVGKLLAELSKEDDLEARVHFLAAYVKEVRREVEEKQVAAEAAAATAKSGARTASRSAGEAAGE